MKHVARTRQEPISVPWDSIDDWVNSAAFDFRCAQKAHDLARVSIAYGSDLSDETRSLWSSPTSETSATTVESDPGELEAAFYYAGLGPKGTWPRLVHRDSPDVFEEPTGPEAFIRMMRLVPVPSSHYFAKNGLWDTVRDWARTVEVFLIAQEIRVSSIDFVRFTWLNKRDDQEIEVNKEEETAATDYNLDDEDIDAAYAKTGDRYYTNPTIWIGVLPDTLNATHAAELNRKIRDFLNGLNIVNVDIAFRESITQSLVRSGPGPALSETGDSLQDFIDSILCIPICGRKTPMQGTLGPYFKHGNNLYAITARRNLFLANDGNNEYRYHPHGPKREVIAMGASAFENYQAAIQARISNLNDSVVSFKKLIATYSARVEKQINLLESKERLADFETELDKAHRRIVKLKQLFVTLSKNWSKTGAHVIGHIVWAPPIGVGVGPSRFTRDVCVVEPHQSKFSKFVGNLLSLGSEMNESDLKGLLYDHPDTCIPFQFNHPSNGLLQLKGITTKNEIKSPIDQDRIPRVLKRGFPTNTTVRTLPQFMSFTRKYFTTGTLESLELPILPHERQVGPFSKGGDSGALVVSPAGELVGLITSGTSKGSDGSDITYATLFQYLWDLVLVEFPGANLCWDDIPAFLAAV
ncbi:hypothetical protein MIND_00664200 [Mycena indigotica]|uniref:Uncharacterized protein n=1 Tax=Mycena indigotica TaxID=2126181 RepID=A0A8H6W440_9AGAR|nr:uncharacterized protein MIND_00664200 [Mycena indigotica]KAF7301008.1 hypothetical protein MIND_00664200 [Mycena indigotica]